MYLIKDDPVIQATTNGGSGTASEVFSTVMYKSFGNGRLGEGCAISFVLVIVVAVFALPLYLFIAKKEVDL